MKNTADQQEFNEELENIKPSITEFSKETIQLQETVGLTV